MDRDRLLLVLTFVGSAICWWPAIITPRLDFSPRMLLVLVALLTGAAALLSSGRWLRIVAACVAGTFCGFLIGVVARPSPDGIANSYAVVVLLIATAAAGVVSLIAGLVAFLLLRRGPVLNGVARGALWVVVALCLAFGPTLFALTRPLVKRRVARNEAIAAVRFASLKSAVEQTRADGIPADRICDGKALQRHYSGPPFSSEDWSRIAGNYVEEDRYVYMIRCLQEGNYLLEGRPKMPRAYGYGVRTFCADESGEIACDLEWNR